MKNFNTDILENLATEAFDLQQKIYLKKYKIKEGA